MALIRSATASDVAAVTEIYAHYVRHSTTTFEIDAPDQGEMERRRSEIASHGLPYLVAELDGRVTGYAYSQRYRPRPAYRFTVEDSIYIHPEYRRRGLGSVLLASLIERSCAAGCRQMIAIIGDSANVSSIALHENLGFRKVGVLEETGYKFDHWIDTVLMQRALNTAGGAPATNY